MKSTLWAVFILVFTCMAGQDKKSKGDNYFFQYAYQQAIAEYEAQKAEKGLSPQQELNLADAYFKTNAFDKASQMYLEAYKKDSLMGNHHFNKMLQSFSKTRNNERVMAFLATKADNLQQELLENADFNRELLQSNVANELDYQIFNVESNSPQSDFAPSFYEEKLLFSSGRPQENKKQYAPMAESYLDLFVGQIGADGQILNPNPYTGVPTSNYHKATPYYSDNLHAILYVLSNTEDGELAFDDNGKNALAIGMQIINGPFRLLLRDLSTSFYYPFYHAETGRLYFAANFEDSYGGTDLYYVATNNGQIMSAPVNLGSRINSPGNEIAPFIFENSLYFSSDVFYGLGGMDTYKSNLEGENSFSIPVNLGLGINSTDDDFGLIIKNEGDGLLGYFSSNRPGGKGKDDIYGFKVDRKPGLKTIALRGKVIKSYDNDEGVAKAVVRVMDGNGGVLKEVYTNEDGDYRLEIPWREEVVLQATKDRHSLFAEKLQFLEGLDQKEGFKIPIGLAAYDDLVEEKEDQKVIKLRKFYFGRGLKKITPEIATELDKVVSFVGQFPAVQLRIETHTDSRGGSAANFRLTQGRSDAIKEYLLQKGVPASNILYSIGYGEQKILNNCHNGAFCLEMLHLQNQRSLIVILNDNILFD
ncbi:OmpA family protein [Allomuricauda sp. SCSIO 65647]|uniref:OmpA family protein n=1 Tax=Allomuricauda sp. SCSIO 65647 TaxID=2908843 RepID=UPI001F42AE0A|nr:OmpA family protein [Muricauda sp. SCSIO 65647]UJH68321.1 OmpA family protein [Muricauda sp. SCSIO 65647]